MLAKSKPKINSFVFQATLNHRLMDLLIFNGFFKLFSPFSLPLVRNLFRLFFISLKRLLLRHNKSVKKLENWKGSRDKAIRKKARNRIILVNIFIYFLITCRLISLQSVRNFFATKKKGIFLSLSLFLFVPLWVEKLIYFLIDKSFWFLFELFLMDPKKSTNEKVWMNMKLNKWFTFLKKNYQDEKYNDHRKL